MDFVFGNKLLSISLFCWISMCASQNTKVLLRVEAGTGVSFMDLWNLNGYKVGNLSTAWYRSGIIDNPYAVNCPEKYYLDIDTYTLTYAGVLTTNINSWMLETPAFIEHAAVPSLVSLETASSGVIFKMYESIVPTNLYLAVDFTGEAPPYPQYYYVPTSIPVMGPIPGNETNFLTGSYLQIKGRYGATCDVGEYSTPISESQSLALLGGQPATTMEAGTTTTTTITTTTTTEQSSTSPTTSDEMVTLSTTTEEKTTPWIPTEKMTTSPTNTEQTTESKTTAEQSTTTTTSPTTTQPETTSTTSSLTTAEQITTTTLPTPTEQTTISSTTSREQTTVSMMTAEQTTTSTTAIEADTTTTKTETTTTEAETTTVANGQSSSTGTTTSGVMCPNTCDCEYQKRLEILRTVSDIPIEELKVQLAPVIQEIKENLTVDASKLSATIRKKQSATDKRASAQHMGVVGAVMLGLTFGLFILTDISSLFVKHNSSNTIKTKC